MKPTVGRIVLYNAGPGQFSDPSGPGNESSPLPAVIVRVWTDTCVNLKVLTDGPKDAWVTSVTEGEGPYCWSWPPRA